MSMSTKEAWGMDSIQIRFCKKKKKRSLNTQGESEHKENELKYVKCLNSFKDGLATYPRSLTQLGCQLICNYINSKYHYWISTSMDVIKILNLLPTHSHHYFIHPIWKPHLWK